MKKLNGAENRFSFVILPISGGSVPVKKLNPMSRLSKEQTIILSEIKTFKVTLHCTRLHTMSRTGQVHTTLAPEMFQ